MFLWGLGIAVFLAFHWLAVPARYRRNVFTALALCVLFLQAPVSTAMIGLLAVIASVLLARGAPRARAGLTIGLALVLLAVHKYVRIPFAAVAAWLPAALQSPLESGPDLRLIGVSYATFRIIHVALEWRRGKLQVEGAGRFLEYVLFPPSFLSGPIVRYSDFAGGAKTARLTLDDTFWGTRRVLSGLLKKILLADPAGRAAEIGFGAFPTLDTGAAWQSLILYSLFIYLDFSAYCDIALGVARLFGYGLPENFRWPYLASDVAEFWRRWHITLSTWLRDYVYLPVSMGLTRVPWLRRAPLATGATAALTSMLVCGLWHGNGFSYVLWGLGHGILLAGHQAYRQQVVGRLSLARRKALMANLPYRVFCTGITFTSVSLLWLFFRFSPRDAASYALRLLGV